MAKRRSSSSGSGGGCLGVIIILAIIGFIMQAWPYLLLIAGCILGIWGLVKLFQHLNTQGNGTSQRVNANAARKSNTVINSSYESGSDVCYEIDRQIKETLVKRRELQSEINRVKRGIAKHSMFWMKNNEQHILAKEELNKELEVLQGRFNAAVYTFREPVSKEFNNLKSSFAALFSAPTKTYDATPASGQISIPYSPVGDMQHINFSTEPVCISLGDNIFCIIPYYIVHFKKSGAYVSTYSCKAIKGGLANGSYDERVKHVTWTYTRADGMPDRRYKNNPQRVYYTTTTHTVWNMLALGIVNYQLKYEVADSVKNGLIAAIKAYSALLPIKSYDPVHHLVRLLKECDKDNANIEKLESIISGGTTATTHAQQNARMNDSNETVHVAGTSSQRTVPQPVSDSKWRAWDILKTIFFIVIGGASGLFAAAMAIGTLVFLTDSDWAAFFMFLGLTGFAAVAAFLMIREFVRIIRMHSKNPVISERNPKNRMILIIIAISFAVSFVVGLVLTATGGSSNRSELTDEAAIQQITEKWQADGLADYTDVAEFEKAVNDGEDVVGKTVTFTVVEVHPDSTLGFDLWGGEHLNFVSDEDPGINEGEEITVIVTGVNRIITDSFKISYILLEK